MSPRSALWLAIVAVLIALALYAVPRIFPPTLDFVEAGGSAFRRLATGGGASAFDPLAGLETAPADATSQGLCVALFGDPATPVIGASGVPVAVFFDVRCPYCRTVDPLLLDLAESGRIRLFAKEWPILGPPSVLAAKAALAAASLGRYPEMRERLMTTSFVPTPAYVSAVAGELGLDPLALAAAAESPAVAGALAATAALARRLGFRGTPAMVVGRTLVEGAIPARVLERLIDVEAEDPGPCTDGWSVQKTAPAPGPKEIA